MRNRQPSTHFGCVFVRSRAKRDQRVEAVGDMDFESSHVRVVVHDDDATAVEVSRGTAAKAPRQLLKETRVVNSHKVQSVPGLLRSVKTAQRFRVPRTVRRATWLKSAWTGSARRCHRFASSRIQPVCWCAEVSRTYAFSGVGHPNGAVTALRGALLAEPEAAQPDNDS
jgi:hypothetical protein